MRPSPTPSTTPNATGNDHSSARLSGYATPAAMPTINPIGKTQLMKKDGRPVLSAIGCAISSIVLRSSLHCERVQRLDPKEREVASVPGDNGQVMHDRSGGDQRILAAKSVQSRRFSPAPRTARRHRNLGPRRGGEQEFLQSRACCFFQSTYEPMQLVIELVSFIIPAHDSLLDSQVTEL